MFGLYQTREYRVVSVFHRRQTESAAPKGGLWTSLDFMSNNEIGRMPGTRNPGNEKQEHLNTFLGVNLNYRKLIASPVASVRIGTLSLLSWRVDFVHQADQKLRARRSHGAVSLLKQLFFHWGHEMFSLQPWV